VNIRFLDNFLDRFSQPSAMDYYVLCVQVSAFLKAGLPLNQALEQIAPHQKNKKLGKILREIISDMDVGMSAAEAFGKQKSFPNIFAPTIESGERASELEEIFNKLSGQMWLRITLYSKINSALLTPKIAGVLMALLMTGFAKVMIPQYEKMFKESGITMPWICSAFVGVINGFFNHLPIVLLVAYGLYRGIKWYCDAHPYIIARLKLRLPIYKPLHYSLINYQFASNLALMLNSGLNVVVACQQTSRVIDNVLLKEEVYKASLLMQAGDAISASLKKADKGKMLDPLVLGFIDSGEKAGSIVEMLEDAAEIHKTLLNSVVDKVSTKLTLLVITPMGLCMVGMYLMSLVPMISYFDKLIK
jgi:type IV pilus assembly protein PilC